ISVKEVFFTSIEGKAAANLDTRWKQAIQNHVTAQMHMLMTVEARRLSAIQAREFFDLAGKHLTKSLSQKRIVKHKRVLVGAKTSANPLMISLQRRRNIGTSETLSEVDMQASMEPGRYRQGGRASGVFNENHRACRVDSICSNTRHDSVGRDRATA